MGCQCPEDADCCCGPEAAVSSIARHPSSRRWDRPDLSTESSRPSTHFNRVPRLLLQLLRITDTGCAGAQTNLGIAPLDQNVAIIILGEIGLDTDGGGE